MQITFQQRKAQQMSSELLTLSRTARQAGYEIDDVRRVLRTQTEFENCRQALGQENEAVSLLTACLVSLSAALNEITELYARAETRNMERLEDTSGSYRPIVSGTLYQGAGDTRVRMEQILQQ